MKYTKPPITEAIIAYQFAGDCPQQTRSKVARKLKKSHPHEEILQEMIMEVSEMGVRQKEGPVGIKLSSADRTSIFNLSGASAFLPDGAERSSAFSASQLAPYAGWEDFVAMFLSGWAVVEKQAGHRKLTRIGVRYVNRIDIPDPVDDPGHWVRLGPSLPPAFAKPEGFGITATIPIDGVRANIGAATAQSPLPHHASIILDIDVYTVGEISDRDDARREILEDFRVKKDSIFEGCITDDARGLFR